MTDANWLKEKAAALAKVQEAVERLDKEDCELGSNLHLAYAAAIEAEGILKRRWE